MRAVLSAVFGTVVLAAVLPAGAAVAGPHTASAASPALQTASAAAPDPLAQDDVSRIIGTTVYDSAGERVGDIATVLMNPRTRQLDRFVVRVLIDRTVGIFGIGGRLVAVPIGAFSWSPARPGFVVSVSHKALSTRLAWPGPSSASEPSADPGSNVQADR